MKLKTILAVLAVLGAVAPIQALAANEVITSEDFESYNTNAIYNTGSITVSYPGYSDASMSGSVIVNAPGGIYGADEAYTGNAAQNMIAYAKTGDTTAMVVPGGLDNGWEGRYSHPVLGIDSTQGAEANMNQYNRRCSVIDDAGGKVLKLGPSNNAYVNTFSMYAYDDVDFSKMLLWESDIKISNIAAGGTARLSLTKGQLSDAQLFTYVTAREQGRSSILDILTFDSDGQILVNGEAAGTYDRGTFYTVSLVFDASSSQFSVTVKNRDTGDNVVELPMQPLDYNFSGITGIEYYANAARGAAAETDMRIDNITVANVTFEGEITSTRKVAINGTGSSVIIFDNDIDETTVNADTIRIYNGDEPVEGVEMTLNNTRQVRLTLPELDPSAVYTVVIDGVRSQSGVTANCQTSFTTVDLVTVSAAQATGDGATYTIRNNANYESSITGLAVFYKDGKIVSDGVHYKKITIPAGGTLSESFEGMQAQEPWDSVNLFFINSITGGFQAVAPQTVIQ